MALGFDCSSSGRRLDDQAREELRGMADQIVQSFLGEANRALSNGCVLRWGRKGSFVLVVAGDKRGLWFDHENEAGGDIIDFLKTQLGGSIGDAIAYALTYLGPSASWSSSTAPKTSQPAEPEEDDAARIDRALRIWSEAQPLRGTLQSSISPVAASTYRTKRSTCSGFIRTARSANIEGRRPWWRWFRTSSRASRSPFIAAS